MWYGNTSYGKMAVKSLNEGAWIYIKGADLAEGAQRLLISAKGEGQIEFRLDDRNAEPTAIYDISAEDYTEISAALTEKIKGTHDIYFAFSDKDICLASWQAE